MKLCSQIVDSAYKYEDGYLYSRARQIEALNMFAKEHYDSTAIILEDIVEMGLANGDDYSYLAYAYIKNNQPEKAIHLVDSGLVEDNILRTIVTSMYFKQKGDYGRALEIFEKHDSIIDSTFYARVSTALNSALSHQYEQSKLNAKRKLFIQQLIIIIGIVLIILLSAVFVLIVRNIRIRHRNEIESKIELAEQLNEIISDNKNRETAKIKHLLASQYTVLEDICGIMLQSPDTTSANKKIARSISSLIENLSIHSDEIERMEKDINDMHENLFANFRSDLPTLKDEDYRLFLFSIYGFSNSTISLFLKEEKLTAVYERKRRLKNKIKQLDPEKGTLYLSFL